MRQHTIPAYRMKEADAQRFPTTRRFVAHRLSEAGFDMNEPIKVDFDVDTMSYVYTQE